MNITLISADHHLLFELCRQGDTVGFRSYLDHHCLRLDLDQAVPKDFEPNENGQQDWNILGYTVATLPWRGRTLLTYAAEKGHVGIVRALIEQGADCEAEDCTLNPTALMAGSRYSGLNVVKYLVEHVECDVNHSINSSHYLPPRNYWNGAILASLTRSSTSNNHPTIREQGETALHIAVDALDISLVKYMILHTGIQFTDSLGMSKQMLSVFDQSKHLKIIQFLIKNCNSIITDTFIQLSLYDACRDGYLPRLQFILHYCIDCMIQEGGTCQMMESLIHDLVFIACERCHLHILHYLLHKIESGITLGVQVDGVGVDGTQSAQQGSSSVAKGIYRREDHATLLFAATTVSMMDYLITHHHIEVDAIEYVNGQTVLMHAAKEGHLECVKYLIEQCHANWKHVSFQHETILSIACQASQVSIVDYLLESELCYNCNMNNGRLNTLCITSQGLPCPDSSIILPNTLQVGVKTVLMYAVELRAIAIVEHLLTNYQYRDSIDVNIQDNEGETALIKAIKHDCRPIITLLLQESMGYKLDITIKDMYGNDARIYADGCIVSLLDEYAILQAMHVGESLTTRDTMTGDGWQHEEEDNKQWIAKRLRRDGYDCTHVYQGKIWNCDWRSGRDGTDPNILDNTDDVLALEREREVIVIDDDSVEEKVEKYKEENEGNYGCCGSYRCNENVQEEYEGNDDDQEYDCMYDHFDE